LAFQEAILKVKVTIQTGAKKRKMIKSPPPERELKPKTKRKQTKVPPTKLLS
jgi:hypothetical protein